MTILISDDNYDFSSTISEIVQGFGYETYTVYSPEDTISFIEKHNKRIAALLLDIEFGPETNLTGIDVLEYCRKNHPFIPVIMITGKGTIATAVKATKLGAVNFIEKSIITAEKLREVLESALSNVMERDRKEIQQFLHSQKIIGSSEKMIDLGFSIVRFARSDLNVLITGETGTGKRLIAEAIHKVSPRAKNPFILVDIPNIRTELFQSELFGHIRGAFTGAMTTREGLFHQANRGTLFLDEIGELSPDMQVCLLNPIQERKIRKIGSNDSEDIDVRIVSATDRNLLEKIEKGEFREQLYHRLRECEINVPPLRERQEDIPEIVDYYLQEFNRNAPVAKLFSSAAISWLQEQQWYGNVRELINVIRVAYQTTDKEIIDVPDLKIIFKKSEKTEEGITFIYPTFGQKPIKEQLSEVEKISIEKTLEKCFGNVSKAAALLNMSRENLHNKIRRYSIDPNIYRKRNK